MDEATQYRQDLSDKLVSAQRRVARARMARQFKGEGSIFLEIARDRLTELNRLAFYKTEPMSREEYLDAHGEVKGINYMMGMVNSYSKEEESATNEVNQLNDQLKQLDETNKE